MDKNEWKRRGQSSMAPRQAAQTEKSWVKDPSWIDSVYSVYSVVQIPEFLTTECTEYTE